MASDIDKTLNKLKGPLYEDARHVPGHYTQQGLDASLGQEEVQQRQRLLLLHRHGPGLRFFLEAVAGPGEEASFLGGGCHLCCDCGHHHQHHQQTCLHSDHHLLAANV